MSYDLYVELGGETQEDVEAIVKDDYRGIAIPDVFERVRLLAGIAARNEGVKDYAVSGDRRRGGGYKSLVHAVKPENTPYAQKLIRSALARLQSLGLMPTVPDLHALPPGSWFLQFTFNLAKPWISKDDDPFYVAESVNPVRKDKVFKVPMIAASSWKGLLRWTAMHTRLVSKKDFLEPDKFAQERFVQTLLFGDEKGEEPRKNTDFAAYLDTLKPDARDEYKLLLRMYYDAKDNDPLPHHSGRLMFYPTFFDLIDVEVINPHSRKTKAGTHPIYLECVPAGASGTFTLIYIPFDLFGKDKAAAREQALADLQLVAKGLQAMFLTYGFSAKRTSGYGVAKDEIENLTIATRYQPYQEEKTTLSQLTQEVQHVAF